MAKALFSYADLQAVKPEALNARGESFAMESDCLPIRSHALRELKQAIPELAEGKVIPFVTTSSWHSHELLAYLLSHSGPADVYISSYALKEFSVSQLLRLIDLKLVTALNCLFDHRIKTHSPNASQLAGMNISRLRLANNHSKTLTIINDTHAISVIGSANFTRNKKIEAGAIICSRQVAQFQKEWILSEMEKGVPL